MLISAVFIGTPFLLACGQASAWQAQDSSRSDRRRDDLPYTPPGRGSTAKCARRSAAAIVAAFRSLAAAAEPGRAGSPSRDRLAPEGAEVAVRLIPHCPKSFGVMVFRNSGSRPGPGASILAACDSCMGSAWTGKADIVAGPRGAGMTVVVSSGAVSSRWLRESSQEDHGASSRIST